MYKDVSKKIKSIQRDFGLYDDLDSPEIIAKAKNFAYTPGILNTELSNEIISFVNTNQLFMSGNWSKIIAKLKKIFTRVEREVIGETTSWIPIKVHKIYCPDVKGAHAKLSIVQKKEIESTSTIKIIGVGGEAGFTIEMDMEDEFSVTNQSVEIIYEFLAKWKRIKLIDKNNFTTEYCTIEDIDPTNSRLQPADIDSKYPYPYDESDVEHKQYIKLKNKKINSLQTVKELTIKAGSKIKASQEIKLESFGIDIGVSYAVNNNWEANYHYELPSGFDYLAIKLHQNPYWIWEVNK